MTGRRITGRADWTHGIVLAGLAGLLLTGALSAQVRSRAENDLQAAIKLHPDAADYFQRAALAAGREGIELDLPDDTLAWKVRSALRADNGSARWQMVMQAINSMSPTEQRDPAWVYWKARGLQVLAKDSQEGEALRAMGLELMSGIAGQLEDFGGQVLEDGGEIPMPLAGHVTSSYRSPALGRTFALAMLAGGHALHGRTVYAPLPEGTVACTVTSPVPYDPDGERRDG